MKMFMILSDALLFEGVLSMVDLTLLFGTREESNRISSIAVGGIFGFSVIYFVLQVDLKYAALSLIAGLLIGVIMCREHKQLIAGGK
jgi:ABC-type uncharacterized transport system permease subunit